MTRFLTRGLVMGTAVFSACAMAGEASFYGRAHFALNHLDDGNDYRAFSVSSNSSRVGVEASHPLRDQLEVIAQFEGTVDIDQANDDFTFSSRNAFGGFRGDWGMVRIGKFDSPLKRLMNSVELFRDQIGDARNVARSRTVVGTIDGSDVSVNFDSRFDNAVGYTSPSHHPLVVNLAYSGDTQEQTSVDGNRNDALSGSLSYYRGNVYAAIAHEQLNFADPELNEREATRLAAAYRWPALTLNGFFQSTTNPNDDVYGVGASHPLNHEVSLKAQYYTLDADSGDDADIYSVGVDWAVEDNLMLYSTLSQISNSGSASHVPWREGLSLSASSDGIDASGESPWALSAGAVALHKLQCHWKDLAQW